MVSDAAWRVEVFDGSMTRVGLCDVWTKLTVTLRHHAAGGWTLELPAAHPQAALWATGARIAVWSDYGDSDTPIVTGPMTSVVSASGDATKAAQMVVTGVDDTALLADRLVLPVPTSPMDEQGEDAHFTFTGPAEAAIRTVVGWNAGQWASAGRRICNHDPEGRLAAGVCEGAERSVSARFDNLLALVGELATMDNLSVRVYQPLGVPDLVLEVTSPQDTLQGVLLSFDAGTLDAATFTLGAPNATNVLVAGGGEGVDRVLVERSTPELVEQWARRVEVLRDARDTEDVTVMEQRGDETLAESAATAGIALEPTDLPSQRYGEHYRLGDTVAVRVAGEQWYEVVTGVTFEVTAGGGAVVRPQVGSPDKADPNAPAIYRRVRELARRLEALEKRL